MTPPRKVIPEPLLSKMIADYGPRCSIRDLGEQTGYGPHIIRGHFVERGVRILGHTEILQGRVDLALDGTDAADRYKAGEDTVRLSKEYGVSDDGFRSWLRRRGIPVRGRGAASAARARAMTPEQRLELTAAARARKPEVTPEGLAAVARGREGKTGANWAPAHQHLLQVLRRAGYKVTIQKAAGIFTMPVVTPRVAFELTNRGPDWTIEHRAERLTTFMRAGFDVVTVCTPTLKFPARPPLMERILEHLAWRDANPGLAAVYAVITRQGDLLPFRTLDAIPDLPPVTAREARRRRIRIAPVSGQEPGEQ